MADPPDFAAEGLLDGLDPEERAARERLLVELHAAGFSLDDLREATREERLPLLPLEGVLRREDVYSAHEVAEAAGIPLEFLERTQRASRRWTTSGCRRRAGARTDAAS